MSGRQRLLFLGSGEFGLPTLEALAQRHEIAGVITQPDRPAGRSQKLAGTPITEWAARNLPRVPLLKPESINKPEVLAQLRALGPTAAVVIAFGQKIGKEFLAERFAVNLHASLLPRWRGAAPINHAILAGDAETGNSVITLADKMDAGLILAQSRRPISPTITAGELHDALAADGPSLILDVLERHVAGTLAPIGQNPALVTLAPKLSRADGWVDFSDDASVCARRINGLSPWPGVTVKFRDEPLRLLRAEPLADSSEGSGMAMGNLACRGGSLLRLLEVQPPGGRAMSWSDFARGRRVKDEEVLIGGKPC